MPGMSSGGLEARVGIEPELIPIAIALVALCVPWLYDGTLFTPQRVWKRKFDRSGYTERNIERYKAWRGVSSLRGDRPDIDEVRRKARQRL